MEPVKLPVSAVVITYNEEHVIERCLRSVRWAAETIVVDCHSPDRTAELAQQMGARVFTREWPGYAAQKNFAAAQATQPWILNIDADEQVTDELAAEIARKLADDPAEGAFSIRIPLRLFGRNLGHYGRAPADPGHVRLFKRGRAFFDDRLVHEVLHVDGSVGMLGGVVIHDSYQPPVVRSYWRKIHRYSALEAQERAAFGDSGGNRWVRAVGKLGWMLLVRRGLLHGPGAWLWIVGQAYQEWLTTGAAAQHLRGARACRELA
jgi:glycosyltransferase involved in cell wall biosynthesis